MRMLTMPFVLGMVCALSLMGKPQPVAAGELDPAKVPADAKWLLHFDMERILGGKIVEEMRESRPRLTEAARGWIRGQYGIDPRDDLHTVTMFSRSYHSYTGTVIMEADYDVQKVEADLRKNTDLKTTEWQNHTLYTVTLAKHRHEAREAGEKDGHDPSGGKEMTVVMVDDKTVVFASSVKNAKETLKLLAGDAESLEGSDSELLSGDWKDAVMYGAAIDLQQVDKSTAPTPVLKQHKKITWTFKERDGKLFEDATLTATSEDVAKDMKQFLQGILAYERLWAGDNKSLKKLVDAGKVSRDGNKVMIKWEAESKLVVDAIDDLLARYENWKPLMRKRMLH